MLPPGLPLLWCGTGGEAFFHNISLSLTQAKKLKKNESSRL